MIVVWRRGTPEEIAADEDNLAGPHCWVLRVCHAGKWSRGGAEVRKEFESLPNYTQVLPKKLAYQAIAMMFDSYKYQYGEEP